MHVIAMQCSKPSRAFTWTLPCHVHHHTKAWVLHASAADRDDIGIGTDDKVTDQSYSITLS